MIINPYMFAADASVYASITFNGTDEYLSRLLSTSSASTTKFTFSFWSKAASAQAAYMFLLSFNGVNDEEISRLFATDTESISFQSTDITEFLSQQSVTADNVYEENGSWNHYVFQYDSTQATAANRVKIYKNGTQVSDTQSIEIDLNEANHVFKNTNILHIGSDPYNLTAQKLAFVDLLEGVSTDPSSFAETISGVWTRKPYTGSYGTYGLSLDGSDGFNDVSGNGQDFTGANMDAGNLDADDLPPH